MLTQSKPGHLLHNLGGQIQIYALAHGAACRISVRSKHSQKVGKHVALCTGDVEIDDLSPQSIDAAKFQPFIARNALRERLLGFRKEIPARDGSCLVIHPLNEAWVEATADVLTDAFADSMGYVSAYRNFLRRQIRAYVQGNLALPPKAVILVAILVPENLGKNNEDNSASNDETATIGVVKSSQESSCKGAAATLIGAVEVSFAESTRTRHLTLNAPMDRPYICNLAVSASWQRQGFGTALMEAAEDVVSLMGEDCTYLHLRFKDAPARALYERCGYISIADDNFLLALIGLDRRRLMFKRLSKDPVNSR